MDLREVVEAFTAMDAYGHPQTIPKCGILHSISDGSGFMGRTEIRDLASFVYLGSLLYVRNDAIEAKTRSLVPATTWRQRYTPHPASDRRSVRRPSSRS
jgi:hypothetical protein